MATWQMRKQTLRDRCEVTEVRAGLEAPPGSLNTKCHAQDRMLSDTYNSCPHRSLLGFLCGPLQLQPHPLQYLGKCTHCPPLQGRVTQMWTSSPAPSGYQDQQEHGMAHPPAARTPTCRLSRASSTHGDRSRHPGFCCPHVCVCVCVCVCERSLCRLEPRTSSLACVPGGGSHSHFPDSPRANCNH